MTQPPVKIKPEDHIPDDVRASLYDSVPNSGRDVSSESGSIPMFTHAEVWRGIDRLAKHHGLTASGLARRAGLDPTTFNPSKRITKQSKLRWPSTESLAKILDATSTPFENFVALMGDRPAGESAAPSRRLRCSSVDQVSREGLFDAAGFPTGDSWDDVDFPALDDRHAYALEVRGDVMSPNYRDGDLLIISPNASIRRHDRVILKQANGPVLAGILLRRTAQRVELAPFGQDRPEQPFALRDVAWLARIIWSSQ
jgi:phage repressor protein C with HTH and peptisase S24 domain